MISFKNVTKTYERKIDSLKDVSFDIKDGEFVFFVGPSGAGKTTIIKLLIKKELPTSGKINFNDVDVGKMKNSELPTYRQNIGVVFQDDKMIDGKTVRENIEFALEITGKDDKELKETTDYLLDVVNLKNRQHLFPRQLSGGERERAGIARALANDPKVFIADEPTGDLDPKTAGEIMDIMKKINKWGTTVIVSTHNKDVVDEMQKRVIRLEEGTVVSDCIGGYECPPDKRIKPSKKAKKEKSEKLADLDISTKIKKLLIENKVDTTDKLLDMTEEELAKIKGISDKSIKEITKSLEKVVNKK
jgi:cell division transport system ATP-binding protein